MSLSEATLISSWGGGTSNSYVSLSHANSIAGTLLDVDVWENATETKRIAALLQAANDIDARPWTGNKVYPDQLRAFPRSSNIEYPLNLSELQTFSIDQQMQQRFLPEAQVRQAIHRLKLQNKVDVIEAQNKGIIALSAGGGNLSNTTSFKGTGNVLSKDVLDLLRHWRSFPRLLRA